MNRRRVSSYAAAFALAACATLPESGESTNVPNAGGGPFRALDTTEVSVTLFLSAPNAIDDGNTYGRDIAVLRANDDASSMAVVGYVAAAGGSSPTAKSPTSAIVRYTALDGRSFDYRSTSTVLTADQPWEGGAMGAPAAVRVGSKVFLYYAAKGGIGLAESTDGGMTFTKSPGPVLSPEAGGWENGATPASPGVVALADGSFRMFYEVPTGPQAGAIGEASSADGATWTRVGSAPALTSSGGGDAGATPWDAASVGSPYPQLAVSSDGRAILRLYYTATSAAGVQTIALAARFGADGAFTRAVAPVFGTEGSKNPHEPCVVTFDVATLLYVTQPDSSGATAPPAVAVGVAPATNVLPPPNPM